MLMWLDVTGSLVFFSCRLPTIALIMLLHDSLHYDVDTNAL
jgi:hypothetical protein